jgi:carbonic anhydrase/acetyltransferase-like protein (isoleucine patch superfamily)
MIRSYRGRRPQIAASAYVDPSAQVIGDVEVGEGASVWCNVTIRGDVNRIVIGAESNIQDNCCLHVDRDEPLEIGDRIVVGHSVTLHGCRIADDCLIGMGATVLSGARIGPGSIIAAGSLVLEGAEVPPQSIVMGAPGKVRRTTTPEERERVRRNAASYVELSREYLSEK